MSWPLGGRSCGRSTSGPFQMMDRQMWNTPRVWKNGKTMTMGPRACMQVAAIVLRPGVGKLTLSMKADTKPNVESEVRAGHGQVREPVRLPFVHGMGLGKPVVPEL